MRKLKSEDLPFVRECNKLRAITGCMRACLKYFLKEFSEQVYYGRRFAVRKQQMWCFLFYRIRVSKVPLDFLKIKNYRRILYS